MKGEVEIKAVHEVPKIHFVNQILETVARMETGSVRNYNDWNIECAKYAHSASKKIFEALVADKKRHYDHVTREW